MEESEDKEKGFKVQDRRRFSAEGEARSGEPEESAAAPKPPPPPPGQESAAKASAHAPNVEINFSMFLVSLSTQALAALGEMADPVTGKSDRDLEGARQLIDILGVLREKTRGNLDQDEKNLLEAILFDLRMKYVELSKPSVG